MSKNPRASAKSSGVDSSIFCGRWDKGFLSVWSSPSQFDLMETPEVPPERYMSFLSLTWDLYQSRSKRTAMGASVQKRGTRSVHRLIDEAMYSFIVANKDALPDITNGFQVVRLYPTDQVLGCIPMRSWSNFLRKCVSKSFCMRISITVMPKHSRQLSRWRAQWFNFIRQKRRNRKKKRFYAVLFLSIWWFEKERWSFVREKWSNFKNEVDWSKMQETGDEQGRWCCFWCSLCWRGLFISFIFCCLTVYPFFFFKKNLHIETLAFLSCVLLIVRLSLEAGGLSRRDHRSDFVPDSLRVGHVTRMLINVETAFVWMYTSLLFLFYYKERVPFDVLSQVHCTCCTGNTKRTSTYASVGLTGWYFNSAVAILLYMSNLYFSDGYAWYPASYHGSCAGILGGVLSGVLALSLFRFWVGWICDRLSNAKLSNRNHPCYGSCVVSHRERTITNEYGSTIRSRCRSNRCKLSTSTYCLLLSRYRKVVAPQYLSKISEPVSILMTDSLQSSLHVLLWLMWSMESLLDKNTIFQTNYGCHRNPSWDITH